MSVSTKWTSRYNLCGFIQGDGLHKLLKVQPTVHQNAGRNHNTDINNKSFENGPTSDIFGTTAEHQNLFHTHKNGVDQIRGILSTI
jgi:hypothetical protein